MQDLIAKLEAIRAISAGLLQTAENTDEADDIVQLAMTVDGETSEQIALLDDLIAAIKDKGEAK